MSFSQFLSCQGIHFLMYLFANFTIGTSQDILANLIMNFITFFFSALAISFIVKESKNLYADVLSISLSFNTMTYLLAYAVYIPFPSWKLLVLDYALVSCLSVLGIIGGTKVKRRFKN